MQSDITFSKKETLLYIPKYRPVVHWIRKISGCSYQMDCPSKCRNYVILWNHGNPSGENGGIL